MNSRLSDPNNHVPEVSPGDDWEDAEQEPEVVEIYRTAALPPRRVHSEKAGGEPESAKTGLRIESHLVRGESPRERPVGLEVQEIHAEVVRLEQEIPTVARVASQFTFHERPVVVQEPLNHRGEDREWGANRIDRTKSLKWIFGMGLFMTLLLLLGLFLLPKINELNAPRKEAPRTVRESPPLKEDVETTRIIQLFIPRQAEAVKIFSAYARARSREQVAPLIGKKAEDQDFVKDWQPLGLPDNWEPGPQTAWAISPEKGIACAKLEGFFPDQSKFSAYFVMEHGKLVLDWKSTTAWSSTTFNRLTQGLGDAREIRGSILPSDFYNLTWPEEEYLSFIFFSPHDENTLWCYARRGSKAANQLGNLFKKGPILASVSPSTALKVTLHLERGPKNAAPNQWLLAEMLHTEWIITK